MNLFLVMNGIAMLLFTLRLQIADTTFKFLYCPLRVRFLNPDSINLLSQCQIFCFKSLQLVL